MSDLNNLISEQSIRDIVAGDYVTYGEYVNWSRAIPNVDGFKPVQRRVVMATRGQNSFCKTAKVVGDVIGELHPHGDASVVPVVSDFVRKGLIDGQGNHGSVVLLESTGHAAMRYTEVKSKPSVNKLLFQFEKYAPHFVNELGNNEPEFLIIPVPIALLYGTFGIGVGTTTRIPAFTYKSLIEAYKFNNPKLLQSQYGYKILSADYDSLWNKGVGKVKLQMEVKEEFSREDWRKTFVIEGRCDLFKPKLGPLEKLREQGRIFIRNETSDKLRLVIGRTPNTKSVSEQQLHEMCIEAATFMRLYDIRVNVFNVIKRIGIKDWLDVTVNLYEQTFNQWKKDNLENLQYKVELLNLIPAVIPLLQQDMETVDIAKQLNREVDIIKDIESKPLRFLRKKDFSGDIQYVLNEIKKLEATKVDSFIELGYDL